MFRDLSPTDRTDRQSFALAYTAARTLQQNGFAEWAARVDRDDPFIHELLIRYQAEHYAGLHCASEHLLRVLLRCARRYAVRLISVSGQEIITGERVSWPEPNRSPVAWRIIEVLCDDLPLRGGAGNSNQKQVSLREVMLADHFGTFDLRQRTCPVKVGEPTTLHDYRLSLENYFHADREPLAEYLRKGGIEPIDPVVPMPQLNGRLHFYPLKSKIVVDTLNTDTAN